MLVIQSNGLIEPGALTLLGASTKNSDQIGKFGSGFKYALSTLIRNKIDFRIFSGLQEIKISTTPKVFRDRLFEVLTVNGEMTSITTETGPEWKLRDAVREIWSNALDEGGAQHHWLTANQAASFDFHIGVNKTTIFISQPIGNELVEMYENWNLYFSAGAYVLEENPRGKILSQDITNYYRRGVWICEDRDVPGLFGYDFHEVKLPESRKVNSGSLLYPVLCILDDCKNEDVFEAILDCQDTSKIEWQALSSWGIEQDNRAFAGAFKRRWDFFGHIKNKPQLEKLCSTQRVYWTEGTIFKVFTGYGLARIEREFDFNETYEELPFPIGFRDRVQEIVTKLSSVGINLGARQMKYIKFKTPNPDIIAAADMKTRACLLTEKAFTANDVDLTKALIEEWTHIEFNVADRTVEQQHVYLNTIISLIARIK
jgi:hypothetical protein